MRYSDDTPVALQVRTLPSFRIHTTKQTAKLNAALQVDYCSHDFVIIVLGFILMQNVTRINMRHFSYLATIM